MGLMQKFKREIRGNIGKPLAYQLRDGFGASLSTVLERVARGHRVHDGEIREFFDVQASDDHDEAGVPQPKRVAVVAGPTLTPSAKQGRFTAIVPVTGVALYDTEYQPYCFSTKLLAMTMNGLANDPTIDSIILIVDTPGGAVTGTKEAGDAIFAARKRKPVTAIVDPLCASAGYWLASQCTKIIAVPSADIGSVGVFMMHADCSKLLEDEGIKPTFIFADESPYKVEGNSYEPLSQEAFDYYKVEVNEIMDDFVAAIARGRGIKAEAVLEKFGKGRCMTADKAKKAGMIDEIASMATALMKLGVQNVADADVRRRRGEAEAPAEQAEAAHADRLEISGDQIADGYIVAEDLSAANANIGKISAEGLFADECEPITFQRESDAEDGKFRIFASAAWPAKTIIHSGLIQEAAAPLATAGETITIAVENGAAVYTKIGETKAGDWICGLAQGSSFTPREDAAAKIPDHQKSAAARRRRLAILAA